MLFRNTFAFSVPLLSKYRARFINKITLIKERSCYGHSARESRSYQAEILARILVLNSFSKPEQPNASSAPEVSVAGCSM